jgi:hypothetical protein
MDNSDMHLRGEAFTRTRLLARYGAAVAAVATALTAVGPAAARELGPLDVGDTVPPAATPAAATPAFIARQAPPSGTPAPLVVARYGFDKVGGTFADLSGHGHTLRLRAGHGGRTRVVPHKPGRALAFPKKCARAKCARAVLQTPHAAELNPGNGAFAFGATVKLSRQQTTKGQNVLQKGYSARGSQYKLQIDGAAGRPSCVLVDRRKPKVRLVKSSVTVADNAWHRIACRRVGTVLSIAVDGVIRGAVAIPGSLSVANKAPLSLGGKGGFQDNDQFQGAFDDVWISMG